MSNVACREIFMSDNGESRESLSSSREIARSNVAFREKNSNVACREIIVSDDVGRGISRSDAAGRKIVVSDAGGRGISRSDSGGREIVVSDTAGWVIVVSDTDDSRRSSRWPSSTPRSIVVAVVADGAEDGDGGRGSRPFPSPRSVVVADVAKDGDG